MFDSSSMALTFARIHLGSRVAEAHDVEIRGDGLFVTRDKFRTVGYMNVAANNDRHSPSPANKRLCFCVVERMVVRSPTRGTFLQIDNTVDNNCPPMCVIGTYVYFPFADFFLPSIETEDIHLSQFSVSSHSPSFFKILLIL